MSIDKFNQLALSIKLLILDVDGVLTDGGLYISNNNKEFKKFNVLDGFGIKLALTNKIEIAVISAKDNLSTINRIKQLGVKHYFTGDDNKLKAFNELKVKLKISERNIAYIGDDILDLPVMSKVILPIAVSNAHNEVKNRSIYITNNPGGQGAAREVIDLLLMAQNKYTKAINKYLQNCH